MLGVEEAIVGKKPVSSACLLVMSSTASHHRVCLERELFARLPKHYTLLNQLIRDSRNAGSNCPTRFSGS